MLEIYNIAIVPLIIGIVELFKRLGLPNKYCPIVAIVCGLGIGIFYLDVSIKEGILVGIMLGLSASGLYSGTKNILERSEENGKDH